MSATTVLPDRIKTIRKARKIGRTRLAKMTGLTERTLTKLETAKSAEMTPDALDHLAHALQITPFVLTGELPLSYSDLEPASAHTCTSGCCS